MRSCPLAAGGRRHYCLTASFPVSLIGRLRGATGTRGIAATFPAAHLWRPQEGGSGARAPRAMPVAVSTENDFQGIGWYLDRDDNRSTAGNTAIARTNYHLIFQRG